MDKIRHFILAEKNAVLPLPPTAFPTSLSSRDIVNLASITFRIHDLDGVLLQAVVNWSATFTPSATATTLTTPGFADVTFEILLNDQVVYRVSQTTVQKENPIVGNFTAATTTQATTALLHFNIPAHGSNTYILRANNIVLTAPVLASGTATTSAAVGAVTLIAEGMEDLGGGTNC
jgi:hypothetical protein